MKAKITVSAPGKLMLLGEHAVVYNHPCIVTTVEQTLQMSAQILKEKSFNLKAPEVQINNYKKPLAQLGKGDVPKGAKFVEIAVKNFLKKYPQKHGVSLKTKSQFSPEFGFGSSSTSAVCTVLVLARLYGVKLTQKQVFDLAYKSVLEIQGKGSGFDIAAAIYGGTIYFVTGGKKIQRLKVNSLPLVVGYSGTKADTSTILNQVASLSKRQPKIIKDIYIQIEIVVNSAKAAIEKKDWQTLGELMNINQGYLESLGVSSAKLSAMIYAARGAGAYGAKLSGAGVGDCMVAIVPESKRKAIEKAIVKAGGKIIKIT